MPTTASPATAGQSQTPSPTPATSQAPAAVTPPRPATCPEGIVGAGALVGESCAGIVVVEGSLRGDAAGGVRMCTADEFAVADCTIGIDVRGLDRSAVPSQWPDGEGGWFTLDPVLLHGRLADGALAVTAVPPAWRIETAAEVLGAPPGTFSRETYLDGRRIVMAGLDTTAVRSVLPDTMGARSDIGRVVIDGSDGGQLVLTDVGACPQDADCIGGLSFIRTAKAQAGTYVFDHDVVVDEQPVTVRTRFTLTPAPGGQCPADIARQGTC